METGWVGRSGVGFGFVLFFAMLLGGTAGVATPAAPEVEDLLWDLQIVPLEGAPTPFTLRGLDGRSQALSAARGQVVLLYFWATW